jgi:hypothetical protein
MRIRRQASVSLPSQANLTGLVGGLYAVPGVTQAVVYENVTGTTDANGVPAHGIWAIVSGGTTKDIANAIYLYKPLGCPTVGGTSYNITQVDGSTFTIYYNSAVAQNLYISINVNSKSGGTIDTTGLKAAIASKWTFSIYQKADVTSLVSLIHSINPDLLVTTSGVSLTAGSYVNYVLPTNKYNYFTVATANIVVTTT